MNSSGTDSVDRSSRRTLLAGGVALAAASLFPIATRAQGSWPDRPIRMVVPFPPGGSSDSLGRVLAEGLREALGTTLVIENKPGGTTQIGTEQVFRADPDGYTILQGSATAFSVLPNMRKVPYDPVTGFEFAGGVADYIAIITARNELGVTTLQQLIDRARKAPGKLTFGSAGVASAGHIAGEILKREAGIDLLHVPFKGSGQLIPALIGGEIDLILDGVGLGMAKSGKAVALAAFSDRRHPELPEVPSLIEAGVKAKLPTGGWGIMAPRGTPPDVMRKLSSALERVVTDPKIVEAMLRFGVVARWTPPDAYSKGLEDARAYYADLLPAIGLKGEK